MRLVNILKKRGEITGICSNICLNLVCLVKLTKSNLNKNMYSKGVVCLRSLVMGGLS